MIMIKTKEMRKYIDDHIEKRGWGENFSITPRGLIAYLDEIDLLKVQIKTLLENNAILLEALRDIDHGPVGYWNEPSHHEEVIRCFMNKAHQAIIQVNQKSMQENHSEEYDPNLLTGEIKINYELLKEVNRLNKEVANLTKSKEIAEKKVEWFEHCIAYVLQWTPWSYSDDKGTRLPRILLRAFGYNIGCHDYDGYIEAKKEVIHRINLRLSKSKTEEV